MKSFRMFWAKFDCKQEHLPTYVLCRYWMVWQMYLMGLKTCILGLSLILVMRWASAGMIFFSRFFLQNIEKKLYCEEEKRVSFVFSRWILYDLDHCFPWFLRYVFVTRTPIPLNRIDNLWLPFSTGVWFSIVASNITLSVLLLLIHMTYSSDGYKLVTIVLLISELSQRTLFIY